MATEETRTGDQENTEPSEIDWKAEARKWEKRAKENAARADKNEDAARRLNQQATRNAESAQRELLRERTARKFGIDDDLLPFLVGESEEELTERAQVISEKLSPRVEEPAPGPAPDPARGQSPGESASTAQQFAAFFGE